MLLLGRLMNGHSFLRALALVSLGAAACASGEVASATDGTTSGGTTTESTTTLTTPTTTSDPPPSCLMTRRASSSPRTVPSIAIVAMTVWMVMTAPACTRTSGPAIQERGSANSVVATSTTIASSTPWPAW